MGKQTVPGAIDEAEEAPAEYQLVQGDSLVSEDLAG